MYDRNVGGKTLRFQVSGKLWNNSLVMQDLETKSQWSHILGEAMAGPLKGKSLEHIPSVMTDWTTWRNRHPDTTVAMLITPPGPFQFRREVYQEFGLGNFALGIVWKEQAYAWRYDHLKENPVLNESVGESSVLVVFDSETATARMFRCGINERTLTFEMDEGVLRDIETKSTWDVISGKAIEGPMKGKQLEPMPAIVTFTQAWIAFHPDSQLIPPRKQK